MAIAQGVSLGPYEILNQIGEGGMGEVWRARDQRIGRDVAIKVLPEFSRGDERVWRFEQEARAAGALNHPNLVTIFDVGMTEDGSPYIVMELLEGETLREVIGDPAPAPMPLRKVIDYASQIASALAVAHEKGIIHRDLKPENLFVTTDGRVKILDFGLAKLAQDAVNGDTRRTGKHLTSAGIAVGTPGYMSPEQVRAQTIDHRTDIFSFGSVVYEMLTGQPAFDCFSAVETMHAVLNAEPPPVSSVVQKTPPAFEAIVLHCLEKNPRDRFQSARDLAFQLRTLLPEAGNSITASSTRVMPAVLKRRPSRATIAIAALVLALAAGGFALYRMRTAAPAPTVRALKQLTFADGLEVFPTLSPDGKTVAYVSSQSGNRDIYVQRTDGRTATNITSDSPGDDSEPAFSPDGSQIAFRSEREGRGGIFVMGVTGESARRLTDFGHNPSWSPDGKRLVIATQGVELLPHVRPAISELWIVDARTGARKPLIQARIGGPDFGRESDAVQPSWSPNGKRIAFWGLSTWFAQRDLWTVDPDAPQPKQTVTRVTAGPDLDWNPVWSPDGKYLYYGSDKDRTLNLWRIPMDEESGKPTGAPELMSLPASISGNFAFSRQGELAYVGITRSYHLIALPFDANRASITGASRMLFGGSQEILTIRLSPDGQSIAYTTGGSAQEDLFIADIAGTRVRQLTNDPARDRSPVWSHDGKTLFFYSNRDGAYRIWSIRADGSGLTRITDENDVNRIGARNVYSPSVSPDGRVLAVMTDRSTAVVHLDRPPGRRIEALPVTLAEPKWSPDGQELVGTDATRTPTGMRGGIVVFSLRDQRSERIAERGTVPQWLSSGRKIVFFEPQSIGTFDLDTRQLTIAPVPPAYGAKYDFTTLPRVSHDGSTIYLVYTVEEGDVWMVRFPPAG